MGRLQGLLAAEQILARENEALRQREQFKAQQDAEARRQNIGLMQFNVNKDLEQQRLNMSANAQDVRDYGSVARNPSVARIESSNQPDVATNQSLNQSDAIMQALSSMTGSKIYIPQELEQMKTRMPEGTKVYMHPGASGGVIVPEDMDIGAVLAGKNPKAEKLPTAVRASLYSNDKGAKDLADAILDANHSDKTPTREDISLDPTKPHIVATKYGRELIAKHNKEFRNRAKEDPYNIIDELSGNGKEGIVAQTDQSGFTQKNGNTQMTYLPEGGSGNITQRPIASNNSALVIPDSVPGLSKGALAKLKELPDDDPIKIKVLAKITGHQSEHLTVRAISTKKKDSVRTMEPIQFMSKSDKQELLRPERGNSTDRYFRAMNLQLKDLQDEWETTSKKELIPQILALKQTIREHVNKKPSSQFSGETPIDDLKKIWNKYTSTYELVENNK